MDNSQEKSNADSQLEPKGDTIVTNDSSITLVNPPSIASSYADNDKSNKIMKQQSSALQNIGEDRVNDIGAYNQRSESDAQLSADGQVVDSIEDLEDQPSTNDESEIRQGKKSSSNHKHSNASSPLSIQGQHHGSNHQSRRTSYGSKARTNQLLHKKSGQNKSQYVVTSDIIMSTNIEDMAVSTSIPQWLIYTWTCKKDKALTDKKSQIALAELLTLKQFVLSTTLAVNCTAAQQDSLAKNLLVVFSNVHKLLGKGVAASTSSSSIDSRKSSGNLDQSQSEVLFNQEKNLNQSGTGSLRFKLPPPPPQGVKRRDYCIQFLEAIIVKEIEDTKYESNLFRSNSVASKLLTLYANQIAKEYLQNILQTPLEQVLQLDTFEVDPSKLAQSFKDDGDDKSNLESVVQSNMQKLLQATKTVFNSVIRSTEQCPNGLQKICHIIQRQVDLKFRNGKRQSHMRQSSHEKPSHETRGESQSTESEDQNGLQSPTKQKSIAISGFMFLRFICPAIVTPEASGIVKGPLTQKQRRNLVLLSKVLQNLANGVKFGSKEAYMTGANTFLVDQEDELIRYCDNLQKIDKEGLYWTLDGNVVESKKTSEMEQSLLQILNILNQQMDKVYMVLDQISVSEVMTYTVFGALKSVIKRFEQIEKVHEALFGNDQKNRSYLDFTSRDNEMLTNAVLLGGLEEVLLMNRYVLIKALLNPANFMNGRSLLQVPQPNSAQSVLILNREMDTIARSVVQVLGPHGGNKLVDVIEWVIEQEVLKKQELLQQSGTHISQIQILKRLLEGPLTPRNDEEKASISLHNQQFGTSMSFKLIISFMFAHTREYLRPLLSDLCLDIWLSDINYEIDPTQLKPEDNLKQNLDNLVNITLKIIKSLTGSISLIPECLKRTTKMLYYHFGGRPESEVNSYVEQNERALRWVSNFLFLKYYCPVIGSPVFYGILSPEQVMGTNQQFANRTFILISYLLRFLINKVNLEQHEESVEESMPYEEEILGPMLHEWKHGVGSFIKGILAQMPSIPSDTFSGHEDLGSSPSLAESKFSKSSIHDPPVPISSSSRSKGIMYIRKILTPYTIKYLKTLVDLKDFKESVRYHKNNAQNVNKSELELISLSRDQGELSGLRVETISYKLVERMRIVLSSLFKDIESQSIPADVFLKKQSSSLSSPSVPTISEANEINNNSKKPEDKSRKDLQSEEKSIQRTKTETDMVKLQDQAKDNQSASRWSMKPNPHNMAQATRNIVRGIFSSVRQSNHDDHNHGMVEDLNNLGLDADKKKLQKSQTDTKQVQKPIQDTDRGLISSMRRTRAESMHKDENTEISMQAFLSQDPESAKQQQQKSKNQKFSILQLKGIKIDKDRNFDKNDLSSSSSVEDQGIIDVDINSDPSSREGSSKHIAGIKGYTEKNSKESRLNQINK